MAVGPALTLLGVFFLRLDGCEIFVDGLVETLEPLRLARLYREGKREEALRGFEQLPEHAVDEMIERVYDVRAMNFSGKEALGPEDSCLQAASLLGTELAMRLALRSRWDESDGHFDSAWKVSFLLDRYKRYQRDWLLASGLFHHALVFVQPIEADELLGDPAEAFWRADRFLQKAVKEYPADPEILLAAGALLEWSGSLRYGEESHLKEAEELYSRALRLSPDDPEALLRHGFVLKKLERNEDAAAPLLRLLELGADNNLIYRSRMALGSLAEAAGRLPEAMVQYDAARALIPSWQVAHVALSHALHSAGNHDRAREILDEALRMEGSDEALLGWWSYELGLAPRFEPLFERMRAEVIQ